MATLIQNIGDEIIAVDGNWTRDKPFEEVVRLLRESSNENKFVSVRFLRRDCRSDFELGEVCSDAVLRGADLRKLEYRTLQRNYIVRSLRAGGRMDALRQLLREELESRATIQTNVPATPHKEQTPGSNPVALPTIEPTASADRNDGEGQSDTHLQAGKRERTEEKESGHHLQPEKRQRTAVAKDGQYDEFVAKDEDDDDNDILADQEEEQHKVKRKWHLHHLERRK